MQALAVRNNLQTISDLLEQLVASLLASSTLACYKLITTCSRLVNNWEQAARTRTDVVESSVSLNRAFHLYTKSQCLRNGDTKYIQ